jgi:hypothetical protein
MILVGSVEPLDELLEGAILFGDVIEILQADDLPQLDRVIGVALGVDKVSRPFGTV